MLSRQAAAAGIGGGERGVVCGQARGGRGFKRPEVVRVSAYAVIIDRVMSVR